jgi:hypothetical protein
MSGRRRMCGRRMFCGRRVLSRRRMFRRRGVSCGGRMLRGRMLRGGALSGGMGGRAPRLDYPGSLKDRRFRSRGDGRMAAIRFGTQVRIAARGFRLLHLLR